MKKKQDKRKYPYNTRTPLQILAVNRNYNKMRIAGITASLSSILKEKISADERTVLFQTMWNLKPVLEEWDHSTKEILRKRKEEDIARNNKRI